MLLNLISHFLLFSGAVTMSCIRPIKNADPCGGASSLFDVKGALRTQTTYRCRRATERLSVQAAVPPSLRTRSSVRSVSTAITGSVGSGPGSSVGGGRGGMNERVSIEGIGTLAGGSLSRSGVGIGSGIINRSKGKRGFFTNYPPRAGIPWLCQP